MVRGFPARAVELRCSPVLADRDRDRPVPNPKISPGTSGPPRRHRRGHVRGTDVSAPVMSAHPEIRGGCQFQRPRRRAAEPRDKIPGLWRGSPGDEGHRGTIRTDYERRDLPNVPTARSAHSGDAGVQRRCWRSRSPTSLPASPGPFSTRSVTSNAPGQTRWSPDVLERGTVLGSVKARPGNAEPETR
jgi:hypothetical protein